jgi:sec-independent protein translocase protein TatB
MFDIAWSEMIVIGAVALIAIGPKDLPKALRAVGAMTAKARRMASEFQDHFREAMREAELDSIKQEVANINQDLAATTSGLQSEFNAIGSQMPAASQATIQTAGEATELDIPGLGAVAATPVEAAPATTLSVEAQPGSVTVTETAIPPPQDIPPAQEKPARKKRAAAKSKAKIEASEDAGNKAAHAEAPSMPRPESTHSEPEAARSEPAKAEPSKSAPSKSARGRSVRKRAAKALPSGDDRAA